MDKLKSFVLEHVSGAFGPLDEVPWHKANVSEPMTLEKARAEQHKWRSEMRENLGSPWAWDSHTRIIAIRDVAMTAEIFCSGANGDFCPECKSATVHYIWPEGQTAPLPPEPSGWFENMCPNCAARDTYWVNNPYHNEK